MSGATTIHNMIYGQHATAVIMDDPDPWSPRQDERRFTVIDEACRKAKPRVLRGVCKRLDRDEDGWISYAVDGSVYPSSSWRWNTRSAAQHAIWDMDALYGGGMPSSKVLI